MNEPATTISHDFRTLRDNLVDYIDTHIPLSRAMGLEIAVLDDTGLVLAAPLAPNVNDKGTAFGGSLSAAMILAGWCVARLILTRRGRRANVVVADSRARYRAPAAGDFRVFCPWPEPAARERFIDRYGQRGRARIELACTARAAGRVVADHTGRYAALKAPGAPHDS